MYAVMLAPAVFVVWMSFFKSPLFRFPPTGYTLRWYLHLGTQQDLMGGFVFSLEIAAAATTLALGLRLLAALGLARAPLKWRTTIEQMLMLPVIIPALVSGLVLYIFYFQVEIVTRLSLVPSTGALLAAHVLVSLPWTFRLIYTGLSGSNAALELASLSLGRNEWQTLRLITLPLLRPSLIAAAVFAFIFSFGNLEISLFLVAPGQNILPVAMVEYAYWKVDPTLAAVATVQMVIVGGLMAAAARVITSRPAFGR